MYLGVDIGGTKTLVAGFDENGTMVEQAQFPTLPDYEQFIAELGKTVATLSTKEFVSGAVAVPGLLDREAGSVKALGNLPWENKPIRDDISKAIGGVTIAIENDSKLGGLSEANVIKDAYNSVLYMTVSTGIGTASVKDGNLIPDLRDSEAGKMPLMFEGKLQHWEDFASGRAIVERFGQKADDITDPDTWKQIGENIAYGLGVVCSVLQPEAIVIGGPVGAHAEQFIPTITNYLQSHLHSVVRQPKAILPAQRPYEAVIYGAYELAKKVHGSAA